MSQAPEEREDKNAVFGDDEQQQRRTPMQDPQHHVPQPLADLGIHVPVEVVPLPSRGVVYPKTSPLHMASEVQIRAMTSREEDILTSRALIKSGVVISRLIQSCLVDKRVNVREMLSGDMNAIMVAVRITGYGSLYETRAKCPRCDYEQDHSVDLSQIPIKYLELQPIEPGVNLFQTTLPKTGVRVLFKFMTGVDEEETMASADEQKKRKGRESNLITSYLSRCVVSVNDREDRSTISRFVTSMPAGDSKFLRKLISNSEPGLEMKTTLRCDDPECGAIEEVPIPLGVSFFWPDS